MSGNGDIGELVGIADTIASPAGTITTRPLIPVSWQTATPTLATGSITTPPEQGGLESDAPSRTDPDQFVGSLVLAVAAPTLTTGSTTTPAGNADVGDVFGAPDLAGEAQAKGLVAFQQVTPTIIPVSGSWLPPVAQGDIPDTGGPTTIQGDTNDSNAGAGTLITWSHVSPTLSVGSIPQISEHGDIGEMYGLGEGPIGQLVWQQNSPTLSTGTVAPITDGAGDIASDAPSAGYGTNSEVWTSGLIAPVLTGVANGLSPSVSLNWTSIGTQTVYNIYRSTNGGPFTLYQSDVQGFSYVDTGVITTNIYSYYVASVLPFITSNIVNPFAGTAAPVLSYTLPGNASIALAWTSVGITTSYSVYRSVNSGAFTLLASGVLTLSYADFALVRGNTYQYYIVPLFPQFISNVVGPIAGTYVDSYLTVGTTTWVKRAGAYQISGFVIGGGGGGGAGSIQLSGTPGGGDGGGGGGFISFINAAASLFGATETITVGLGGAGAPNTTGTGQFAQSGGQSSIGTKAVAHGGTGGQTNPLGGPGVSGGSTSTTIPGAYTETGGQSGGGDNRPDPAHPGGSTTLAPAGGAGSVNNNTNGTFQGAGGACGALAGGLGGVNAISSNGSLPITGGDGANGQSGTGIAAGSGGGAGGLAEYPGFGVGPLHSGNGGNGGGYGGGGGGGGSGLGNSGPGASTGANGGNGAPGAVQVTTNIW